MRRSTLLAAFAVAAGCSDINLPPNHTPAYGYDLSGDVFHWPVSRLPVRFFGDTRGPMRSYLQRAIGLWEDQFLYGEFRGTLVADSADADVIVTWTDSVPADVPPDNGTPVDACNGFTTLIFDGSGTALAEPIHVQLSVLIVGATSAQLAACMRRTVVHELGHTLGLWQEASDSLVIMNFTPWVPVPSDKDRRTVEYLYHVTPSIAPPPP